MDRQCLYLAVQPILWGLMTINNGDRVRIEGERGTYKVFRSEPYKDGSILLYGGDSNPNGVRGFRAVMPAKLVSDKRRPEKGS